MTDMTRSEPLEALAARVEALAGPCREVDAEIAGTEVSTAMWHDEDESPSFTASLDAATTLVPSEAFWSITMSADRRFHACCQRTGPLDWREAATPALALTAAALRARATQKKEQQP